MEIWSKYWNFESIPTAKKIVNVTQYSAQIFLYFDDIFFIKISNLTKGEKIVKATDYKSPFNLTIEKKNEKNSYFTKGEKNRQRLFIF